MTEKLQQFTQQALETAQENLEELTKRGESLQNMENDAESLQDASKQILRDARELDFAALWRKYGLWIIVYGTIGLYVLYKLV